MKTIGRILLTGFVLSLSLNSLPAQTAPSDDIVTLAADSQGLSQVDPLEVPVVGSTCWWILPGGQSVPMPFLPPDGNAQIIYQIAPQQFLVDQTGGSVLLSPRRFGLPASATAASMVAAQIQELLALITQIQTTAANQQAVAMARAMGVGISLPGGSDGNGTNFGIPSGLILTPPDYGTNLWLAITSATNGVLSLVLSNTVYTGTGGVYEVTTTPDLSAGWSIATEVWAVSNQNWIAFTVPMSSPTNLFVWARDWTRVDSDGDGVPDWWKW